jgi:excisionase family DNA binding protein
MADDYSVSLREAVEQLPVSSALVYDLVRKGVVSSIRIGKKYFLRATDVDYIRKHGTAGLPKATPVVGKPGKERS